MKQLITQEMLDNLPLREDVYDGESGLHIYKCSEATDWFIEALDFHLFSDESDISRIGSYPDMSLQQARAAYKEYLAKILKEVAEKLAYEETKGL